MQKIQRQSGRLISMKLKLYSVQNLVLVLLTSITLSPVQTALAGKGGCIKVDKSKLMMKSQPYNEQINLASRKYAVDAYLIRSVIAIESCYQQKAVSSAGAQGLMQLMPDTADRFGVSDSFDSAQNIDAGTKYLRFLQRRYKGELTKVLAAYNAGEGRVDYYKGIPPFKETRLYVKNVLATYKKLTYKSKWASAPQKAVTKKKKVWGKPGRQGYEALKLKAPHLFKQ